MSFRVSEKSLARLEWPDLLARLARHLRTPEARAALAAARRASRLSKRGLERAREEFEAIWPQLEVVEVSRELVRRAGDLAELEGLRGYDAVHLAAALRIDADVMASADRALCQAAARHGRAIANPQ